jgi:hypothetical protein
LTHIRLLFAQISQHEMPAVAEETFGTGLFTAFPCFFAAFSPAGGGDFLGRVHGDEATVLALLADDNVEVDGILTTAFEVFLQSASIG